MVALSPATLGAPLVAVAFASAPAAWSSPFTPTSLRCRVPRCAAESDLQPGKTWREQLAEQRSAALKEERSEATSAAIVPTRVPMPVVPKAKTWRQALSDQRALALKIEKPKRLPAAPGALAPTQIVRPQFDTSWRRSFNGKREAQPDNDVRGVVVPTVETPYEVVEAAAEQLAPTLAETSGAEFLARVDEVAKEAKAMVQKARDSGADDETVAAAVREAAEYFKATLASAEKAVAAPSEDVATTSAAAVEPPAPEPDAAPEPVAEPVAAAVGMPEATVGTETSATVPSEAKDDAIDVDAWYGSGI